MLNGEPLPGLPTDEAAYLSSPVSGSDSDEDGGGRLLIEPRSPLHLRGNGDVMDVFTQDPGAFAPDFLSTQVVKYPWAGNFMVPVTLLVD